MNRAEYKDSRFGFRSRYSINGDKLTLEWSSWLLGKNGSIEFPLHEISLDFKTRTVRNWIKWKGIFVFAVSASAVLFIWHKNGAHLWEYPWQGNYFMAPIVFCAGLTLLAIASLVVGVLAKGVVTSLHFRTDSAGAGFGLEKRGNHQPDFDAFLETLLLAIREARGRG